MDSTILLPTSPRHIWRDEDRLILSLMDTCYRNQSSDLALMFNSINRIALRREGFKTGMPVSSLTAMLWEFKHEGPGSKIYRNVSSLSKEQIDYFFGVQIDRIKETARSLGVQLIQRSVLQRSQRACPSPPVRRRLRFQNIATETTVTSWNEAEDEDDDEEMEIVESPTRRPWKVGLFQRSPGIMQETPFLSTMMRSENRKTHYLLYRAYEVNHDLTARRFLDSGDIPPPPHTTSEAFRNELKQHLERDLTFESPFLSFAQNPAVALKHAFKKISTGTSMCFAIFPYDRLRADQVKRFGRESGPYLVPIVVKQHALWNLPGGYTGNGEFLIWGSIESKPMAVFRAVDILMIRAIVRTTKSLDFQSGVRLAKYIPPTDDIQHLELFVYQLLQGSKIRGFGSSSRKSKAYNEFLQGVLYKPHKPGATEANPVDLVSDDEDYDKVGTSTSVLSMCDSDDHFCDDADNNDDEEEDYEMVDSPESSLRRSSFPIGAWRDDSPSIAA